MADQPHAVHEKVAVPAALPRLHHLQRPRPDLAARRPGPHPGEGRLLHRVDLRQQVLQLRVRLAEQAHPRQVADVAVEVAARINR